MIYIMIYQYTHTYIYIYIYIYKNSGIFVYTINKVKPQSTAVKPCKQHKLGPYKQPIQKVT